MTTKKRFVPVVAVLNMKGGVGKTTLSANVFRVLFEKKQLSVLLVDLDPQFNLTQTLYTRADYEKLQSTGRTILSIMEPSPHTNIFVVNTNQEPPPPTKEVAAHLFHFVNTPEIRLEIVPGNFNLVKYSLMDDNKSLDKVKQRFIKFIDNAKSEYHAVCIDCNPSSSFLTLCALQVCTHVLVPIKPDRYSVLGLEILAQFIDQVPSIDPKPHILAALNGIDRTSQRAAPGSVEADLRSHPIFGTRTLANVIYKTELLHARADYTGFATDRKAPWRLSLLAEVGVFVDELASKLGL